MNQVCLFGYFLLFHVFFIWFLDVNNDGAKKRQSKFMLLIQIYFIKSTLFLSNRNLFDQIDVFVQIDVYLIRSTFILLTNFFLSNRHLFFQIENYLFKSTFTFLNRNLFDQIMIKSTFISSI